MTASTIVTVRHNVEVAHRLFTLPGKCFSLHGHSMWVTVDVAGPVDAHGVVVEFGAWKRAVRGYLDGTYDHRAVLHPDDPLVDLLTEQGSEVTVMDGNPTTELLAATIGTDLANHLADVHGDRYRIARVTVDETRVNAATWTPA